MAHVLTVAAFEIGHPVPFLILVETDDAAEDHRPIVPSTPLGDKG
jgi:hypothetical protein